MTTRTTVHVDNLHCASCASSITSILTGTSPLDGKNILVNSTSTVSDVDISLQKRTISFTHPRGFNRQMVLKQLDAAGFDVRLTSPTVATRPTKKFGASKWKPWLTPFASRGIKSSQRQRNHREICDACRASRSYHGDSDVTSKRVEKQALQESRFAIEGMTCR